MQQSGSNLADWLPRRLLARDQTAWSSEGGGQRQKDGRYVPTETEMPASLSMSRVGLVTKPAPSISTLLLRGTRQATD